MTDQHQPATAAAEAAATGLDALIGQWPSGPLGVLPAGPAVRMAAALAARPGALVRRGAGLAAELARIGAGRSRVLPGADDERYADPAWTRNPLLRRLAQAHLAASASAEALVSDAGLGADDEARLRAAVSLLSGALSPAASPLNPAVWRAAAGSGGASAVRGARRLVADVSAPPRAPCPPRARSRWGRTSEPRRVRSCCARPSSSSSSTCRGPSSCTTCRCSSCRRC
jgi:polyhydroxyalkanoate synthase